LNFDVLKGLMVRPSIYGIVVVDKELHMERFRCFVFFSIIVALGSIPYSVIAEPQGVGKVECQILENGGSATGTISLQRDGREVKHGTCGGSVSVKSGSYMAVVSLDGVLNGAEQRHAITVRTGKATRVVADFPTGFLQVNILSNGKKAAGMAVIRKDSRQIGTLGSGVSAHVSVGTYRVVARYRSQEKAFDNVIVEASKRVVLEASF